MKKTDTLAVTIIFFIAILVSNATVFADEFYDWASGYKFRTNPIMDGSMDAKDFFKNEQLSNAQVDLTNINYVDMRAYFPVSQENWTSTTACREGEVTPLDPMNCLADGQIVSKTIEWKYTCKGDVQFDLVVDNSQKDMVGGDTMYGAWSMLFNYLPPAFEESCAADGRCFVGNVTVTDTKAQKESHPGLFPGLGQKNLVEAPGEVYYFDQVRSLTQPPGFGKYEPYNNVFLVGQAVEGGEPLDCNLPDLSGFDPEGECGICNSDSILGPLAKQILTAAAETFTVPAAVIWSAMMHEGATWSDYAGQFTDENVLKWSLPVGCPGYEPMPRCDELGPASTPPFGLLKYWFYLGDNGPWTSVQRIDPQRNDREKVSRCNFMDAAFAAANMLRQGSTMWDGSPYCDDCEGYDLNTVRPATCADYSDLKAVQSNIGFIGQCPDGTPVTCSAGEFVDPITYHTGYILGHFKPYKCY